MPPTQYNAEGYWENQKFVELNDELLAALGGGWDYPPTVPCGWTQQEELSRVAAKARFLLAEFTDKEPWGWKDPRSSLLAHFWMTLIPDLRFVICLRNPLEVADSLWRRNDFSLARGLSLWKEYYERLLAETRQEQRIVTHYDAYFTDWEAELCRVLAFLQIAPQADFLEQCASVPKTDLRHKRVYTHQLLDGRVPSGVLDLYTALCEEAGWRDGGGTLAVRQTAGTAGGGASPGGLPDAPASEPGPPSAAQRADAIRELQHRLAAADEQIDAIRRELCIMRDSNARNDQVVAELREQLEATREQLEVTRQEQSILTKRIAASFAERDQVIHELRIRLAAMRGQF